MHTPSAQCLRARQILTIYSLRMEKLEKLEKLEIADSKRLAVSSFSEISESVATLGGKRPVRRHCDRQAGGHKMTLSSNPPVRCDVRPSDVQDMAIAADVIRRIALQYHKNPLVARQLGTIRDFLTEQYPLAVEHLRPKRDLGIGTPGRPRCTVCADECRKDIDAAVHRGVSVRQVARQFRLSKSAIHRHRRHMSHEQP